MGTVGTSWRWFWLGSLRCLVVVALAACAGPNPIPPDGSSPDAVVNDGGLPPSAEIDSTAPEACLASVSWQDDVAPLLNQYCGGSCHGAGEAWGTCLKTQNKATAIKNYVKNGLMPPADSPQLSEPQRQVLYDWIAHGKPCDSGCP